MSICTAKHTDLAQINQLIAQAVMAWPMPERIKRLSVPVLSYDSEDFKHYQFLLLKEVDLIVGVAVWNAKTSVMTARGTGRLLHGLYIAPAFQGRGYGQQLMGQIFAEAGALGVDGVLVKAERPALGFFKHCALQSLPASNDTDYPYQFWHQLKS